jgi:TorA maturation chaperone TorD
VSVVQPYALLSNLWLHEAGTATLAQAREFLGLQTDADPPALAAAYADLFLLNVYPYGTAYTDAWGEINTHAARQTAARYERHTYRPPELSETGGPDHLGLGLGFLAHLQAFSATQNDAKGEGGDFFAGLLDWAPICCLAAERDPAAHPFYRALAKATSNTLLTDAGSWLSSTERVPASAHKAWRGHADASPSISYEPADELRLRDVVRFLLVPARSGMFLSRARLGTLANALGMRLPFGSRMEVAEWLFAGVGQSSQVLLLLQALDAEAAQWDRSYRECAEEWPLWQPIAVPWRSRIAETRRLLAELERQASHGVELTYANPAEDSVSEGDV